MEGIERSAASVEEAVESALQALGLSEQEADIEIVQEPRSGWLGLKAQQAVVRVHPRRASSGEPGGSGRRVGWAGESEAPQVPGPSLDADDGPDVDEVLEEQEQLAFDYVRGLVDAMGLRADVEVSSVDGSSYVDIWPPEGSDEGGVLIGRRGHTLDSLQELLRGYIHRETGDRCRVLVDVEDYRKRQRDRTARKAEDVARRVRRSGRPEALEPMRAAERKLVHDLVARMADLETVSEGEEPERRVVIRPGGTST